ncbi:hypothetical protein QBC33DRAFT_549638 [Phialemonium atrogriseum]|uniref:Aminoglycoside phosphotransferase domain-containing protein n=1 Tax=Phialemonium atrogriseum TaxID=1093897 RepID=A0AAJ0FCB4_9PEZI|nr:uncharacterized protein QBC33DRAFT_549638 [Phialemonium atrogriseum]KAK1763421.1 hypothetical protein QBC33DRAFT_549638 [Phialemonium atrogriseum]
MKQEPLPSQLLLRIAMPWDPYYKVESEVATMMLVDRLGIPTPRVFFFDSSARNPLGLECIFMERVGGVRIYELWAYNRRGYDASYISVASQVKDYLSRLWEHSFDLIGNVYYDWDGTRDFFIGPIVCVEILKTTASWIGWSPSCGRPQRRAI